MPTFIIYTLRRAQKFVIITLHKEYPPIRNFQLFVLEEDGSFSPRRTESGEKEGEKNGKK